MSLPDAATLLERLTRDLQAYLAHHDLAPEALSVVGVHTGGVWVAQQLSERLGLPDSIGTLDIGFWRDDFDRQGLPAVRRSTALPFAVDEAHILLVDDVVMSGRTVRAALNELFDFGRPSRVTLAALLELPGRELPVRPDVVGGRLDLPPGQRFKLDGPTPLTLTIKEC